MATSYYFAGKSVVLFSIAIPNSPTYSDFGLQLSSYKVWIKANDPNWNVSIEDRIKNRNLPDDIEIRFNSTGTYSKYKVQFLGKHDDEHYLLALKGEKILPDHTYTLKSVYRKSDNSTENPNIWQINTLPNIGKITCSIGSLLDAEQDGEEIIDNISGFPTGIKNAVERFVKILNEITTIDYHIQLTTGNQYADYLHWKGGPQEEFEGYLNFGRSDTDASPTTLLDLSGNSIMSNQSDESDVQNYMQFATGQDNTYWVWRGKVNYPVRGYMQIADIFSKDYGVYNSCDAYLYKIAAAYQASRGVPKYYLYNVTDQNLNKKYYAQYVNGTYIFRIPYYNRDTFRSNIPFESIERTKNGITYFKTNLNPDDGFTAYGTEYYLKDYKGPYKVRADNNSYSRWLWYNITASSYILADNQNIEDNDRISFGYFLSDESTTTGTPPEETTTPEPEEQYTIYSFVKDNDTFVYDHEQFIVENSIKISWKPRTTEYYISSYSWSNWTQNGEKFTIKLNYDDTLDDSSINLGLQSLNNWYKDPTLNDTKVAWGETTSKAIYKENNYKFYDTVLKTYTKYNGVDNLVRLKLEDDYAHVTLGKLWQIPDEQDIQELLSLTSSIKTIDGVEYAAFKDNNSNEIYFKLNEHYWISEKPQGTNIAKTIKFNKQQSGNTVEYNSFSTENVYDAHYIKPVEKVNTYPFYIYSRMIKAQPTRVISNISLTESQIDELKGALGGYIYSHSARIPKEQFPQEYFNSGNWTIRRFNFTEWDDEVQEIYTIYENSKNLLKLSIQTIEDNISYVWEFYLDDCGRPFKVERNKVQ